MSWAPWIVAAVLAVALAYLLFRLASAEAALRAEREKNQWTADAKEQFANTFKVLATTELESRSGQLKSAAKEELSGVIAPLKEELGKLDKQVRELEAKREGAYSSLGAQLQGLHNLQDSLRQQTTTLAQALKSPTVRGRWGEIHLRRLVELSGMSGHVDFSDSLGLSQARVYFEGPGGVPIQAPIADTLRDWADRFVVTAVPQEIPDTTQLEVACIAPTGGTPAGIGSVHIQVAWFN